MKKQWGFLVGVLLSLLVFENKSFSQCPYGVGIDNNPIGLVCKGDPVIYTAAPANGAQTPQYIWVVNGDTVGSGSSITNTSSGTVMVYMTTSNCPDTFMFNNVNHPQVYFDIDYQVIIEECNQTQADLQINEITSFGGVTPYTYNLLTQNEDLGEQDLYADLPVGNYPIYVVDAQGCEDTLWAVMEILECPPPIPSVVITPNGDGANDMWYIQFIELYPDNEVFIFDRWGQRVYHKKEYDNVEGWEVKYSGGDLPVSTYYYVLNLTLEKSENVTLKGAISVFR